MNPSLSICIPTYNRAGLVSQLVQRLLSNPGSFEICVHVDGSTDDTLHRLSQIQDPRLRVSSAENQGRAGALVAAVASASGRYCMLFDDDDDLSSAGLARVLRDCAEPLPDGCVGRVYHLADEAGIRVGTSFPVERSNLVALRADYGVRGDKKEVVLTEPLRVAMRIDKTYRRVPTSLYWTRLAMTHDILCINEVIGKKNYLEGGMSDSIKRLKQQNAAPMILLHKARLSAFVRRRFKSWRFAGRSVVAILAYSANKLRFR
ncbi:glycosyltransferase family 2 protein [Halomonas alkalicola]|uniref:Glycosyltransferase n=1 Tax=Halomonas alkalicola TaxID=1930622 RepID=A0ABY9H504_9GAMM|nr:glycosyltransferase [Halomonas alkalicola]WLI73383.1 glycosyltransferase [Halomonas alkalicola]